MSIMAYFRLARFGDLPDMLFDLGQIFPAKLSELHIHLNVCGWTVPLTGWWSIIFVYLLGIRRKVIEEHLLCSERRWHRESRNGSYWKRLHDSVE